MKEVQVLNPKAFYGPRINLTEENRVTAQPSDIYTLLKKIRYDATAIQGKVTDALKLLTELNLPDQPAVECPHCGLELPGERTLSEHLYNSHNGPVPAHYAAIEARAIEPTTDESEAA